jgi:hypothetical protein
MNNHVPLWHTAVMMEERKTDAQISADAIVGLVIAKACAVNFVAAPDGA